MKKKKMIKRLERAKKFLITASAQNRSMITPDWTSSEKAAFESGIFAMNASAVSVIDAMIIELKHGRLTYGGFVTIDDEMKMQPSERIPWD